jgi:hypothetical protein
MNLKPARKAMPDTCCIRKRNTPKCIFDKMLWPPKVRRSANFPSLLQVIFRALPFISMERVFPKKVFSNRWTLPFFARIFKTFWSKGQSSTSRKEVSDSKTGTPHWPGSNIQIDFFHLNSV